MREKLGVSRIAEVPEGTPPVEDEILVVRQIRRAHVGRAEVAGKPRAEEFVLGSRDEVRVEFHAGHTGAEAREGKTKISFTAGAFKNAYAFFESQRIPDTSSILFALRGIAQPFLFRYVTEPLGNDVR